MDTTPCRACGSSETRPRYQLRGYRFLSCASCGSITTAFQMSSSLARAFYGLDYFHGGDYQDYQASEAVGKRNFERLVRRLAAIRSGGRMLEIGCAYGYFLDVASPWWEVVGVDISEEAISSCSERFGEAVHAGDFLDMTSAPDTFDWVVAWDTIEHLDQPRRYLDRAFALLKPGGHVALTTGDVSSFAARIMTHRWRLLTPPSHLTFFSRQGMARALSDSGFQEVRFGTMGYSRSLDFVAYRLSLSTYERLVKGHNRLVQLLQQVSFYVNLHDIMFVVASKPNR